MYRSRLHASSSATFCSSEVEDLRGLALCRHQNHSTEVQNPTQTHCAPTVSQGHTQQLRTRGARTA